MIFYRLTDKQARSATTALTMAPFIVAFLALRIAEQGRLAFAVGLAALMAALLALIGVQIVQSRRINRADREVSHG